ncbi:TPA: hypothetical protein ACFKVV_10960 [Neisseria gonorrhoeae]
MYPFPTRKPHENVWRINENQDKAAKPRTVRQGEATPYWFKFNSLYIPSFPRKRESRIPDFQIIFEYCCCSKVRIPACAGMTNPSVRKPAPRHSHKSGNPGRKISRNLFSR